ncbi:ADP-ribosylation family protein [Streptomyces coeruleoprunus]|uniref:ADP-ribosylation family protein n=1 Tax=Streptomyces coeruleoprunus TaxID=285563 RepID=A0ABV9XEX6_9ACTN
MQQGQREAVAERVARDWGLELPEPFFVFAEFLDALDPEARRALGDIGLSPCGITDLFRDPAAPPRDGLDARVHGRYYRDPPEFLTFLHGGSDGLHFGLWYDDGRTCAGVASYRTLDGGGIDRTARTPLEAVRAVLERCWRDLDDDPSDDEETAAHRTRLGLLRRALTGFGTADRTETGLAHAQAYDLAAPPADHDRVTTLDGGGALVAGDTVDDRPPHNAADEYRFATHMYAVLDNAEALRARHTEALRRCASGDPAEALVLGRDLHWASGGDAHREALAAELLVAAYRALDRPALGGVAAAHHRHRALPRVEVLVPGPA